MQWKAELKELGLCLACLDRSSLWREQCSGQWGREVGGSAGVTQGTKGSMCVGWRELCPVPNLSFLLESVGVQ